MALPLRFDLANPLLDFLPGIHINNWLVVRIGQYGIGIVELAADTVRRCPAQLSNIHRVAQDILNGAVFKGVSAMGFYAQRIEPLGNDEISFACEKSGKNLAHKFRFFRDGHQLVIPDAIAKGRSGLQTTTAGLFRHTAPHFFRQVQRIEFVHGFDDGFVDDAHFAGGNGLGDGNHINAVLFTEHGFVNNTVLAVSGETGEFPDQDPIKGAGRCFRHGDHPLKFITVGRLPAGDTAVDEHEVIGDEIAAARGPLPDLDQLSIGRILRLFFGTDADVGGSDLQTAVLYHRDHLLLSFILHRATRYDIIKGYSGALILGMGHFTRPLRG